MVRITWFNDCKKVNYPHRQLNLTTSYTVWCHLWTYQCEEYGEPEDEEVPGGVEIDEL